MPFHLSTLFLLFVVLASSVAVFGIVAGSLWFLAAVGAALALNKTKRLRTTLLLTLGLMSALAIALFSPVQFAVDNPNHEQCGRNLRRIGSGLHNYVTKHHRFPPSLIPDKNGRPMHSWRILIRPFLEGGSPKEQYNFNEPWDGPNNKMLFEQRPECLACPSHLGGVKKKDDATSYVAVVGKNALWQPDEPKEVGQLSDRLSNSVVLIEVPGCNVIWTEPRDFNLDKMTIEGTPGSPMKLSGSHFTKYGSPFGSQIRDSKTFFFHHSPTFSFVVLGDGRLGTLPSSALGSEKLKDWLSIEGFNEAEIASLDRTINWPNCAIFAVWIASTGWLLARAVRSRTKAVVPAGDQGISTLVRE